MTRRLRTRLFVRSLEERNVPTAFTVTNLNDSGAGSLRQAVLDANAMIGGDTVSFQPGLVGTIVLTNGVIAVNDALTVVGPGAKDLTISGNNSSRIFNTSQAPNFAKISIDALTLSGGKATSGNSAGGAIAGDDQVIALANCVLNGNTADYGGAVAIVGGGELTVTDCALTNNSANGFGGAIGGFPSQTASPRIILRRTTISGNTAADAGGLYARNYFLMDDSTISDNSAETGQGGGIFVNGSALIRNSTISGNNAYTDGGGIAVFDFNFNALNCTITDNTATNGFGGGLARIGNAANINFESSIVSGNTGGGSADIFSAIAVVLKTSAVGSIFGFTRIDHGGNLPYQPHANLKLGALVNNGGPTLTHRPAGDSPLIDAGSNPAALTTDQRGGLRIIGNKLDIGAVESPNLVVFNDNNAGAGSLRQTIEHANSMPGPDTITFDSTAFAGTDDTITLTTGELAIMDDMAIIGPGSDKATISGNALSRIFNIDGAGTLSITISGLGLTQGKVAGNGGAIYSNGENLTIQSCLLTQNTASGGITNGGGAIFVEAGGLLTVNDSRIANNFAASSGGGFSASGGAVVQRTTIADNSANSFNGGFEARVSLTVDSSTISGNKAFTQAGGGFQLGGTFASSVVIRNSTISGNSTSTGGGGISLFLFNGTLLVQNSTITNNTGNGSGGGISRVLGNGVITLVSSIISGNSSTNGPDIYTSGIANLNNCLLGSVSGIATPALSGTTVMLVGTAANLGPLANNGGPTQTHALLWSSPAIGQGSNPIPAISIDQRGKSRTVGNIDIGAFELQPAAKVSTVVVGDGTNQRSMVTKLTVTFNESITFTGTPSAAFALTRQSPVTAVNLAVSMDPTNTIATLTFTGGAVEGKAGNYSLADGRYTIDIFANQIGADGLDGNSNGTGGDNYQLIGDPAVAPKLFRLFGDADGNNIIDLLDFAAFRGAFNPNFNTIFDFDGSGTVDLADFGIFRGQYGKSV